MKILWPPTWLNPHTAITLTAWGVAIVCARYKLPAEVKASATELLSGLAVAVLTCHQAVTVKRRKRSAHPAPKPTVKPPARRFLPNPGTLAGMAYIDPPKKVKPKKRKR